MSTEQQTLLELVAKAIGVKIVAWKNDKIPLIDFGGFTCPWNPLDDDGDALRVAVKLRIEINLRYGFKQVCCRRPSDRDNFEMHGLIGYGKGCDREPTAENVRRAIVLAAAAIGRAAHRAMEVEE